MPTIKQKPAGAVGLPTATKEQGKRVDFKPNEFSLAIETKGYRVVWKRSSYCPCNSVNDQTQQPDPNCSICEGSGWLLFAPSAAVVDEKLIGDLDDLQTSLSTGWAIIHVIMSSVSAHDTPYDQAVRRIEGLSNLTARAENKLGYHDQLINLDATIPYTQIVIASGGSTDTTTYPIVEPNLLRSATEVFDSSDFSIVNGEISWVTPPAVDTKLAIHYLTYPHWRVTEYPHAMRHTLVKAKSPKPVTPRGDPTDLPVQAIAQLEFLVGR